MDKIDELLTRGVENIYPSKEELEKVLRSGKKLRLYQGFDPSMPSLHLGNLVGLMKLRQFQKLGHEVIFLVGDFTGMIGDPTDKTTSRPRLTREQTRKNAEKWQEQASRVLDFSGKNPVKIMFNSSWNDLISFKDLISICANFTVQQMLERDMFQERLKAGQPIHLHEFLYPVAQAIDCVEMDVDLELGGNDQTFNMLAGRQLMKSLKNKEKFVMTTKLLVDAQGEKVGKTTGNALFLDSTPEKFYGGIMSFPDEVIGLSFELLTEVPLEGIEEKIKTDPMGEKKRLAFEIVKLLWGIDSAQRSQKEFENVFQMKKLPKIIPEIQVRSGSTAGEAGKWEVGKLLLEVGLVKSTSEAKRLVREGAVDIDGKTISSSNEEITLKDGTIIKKGKNSFVRIRVNPS